MGTLIPLAPGLGALGQGNYSELASDLRLAFSATVIGLLVGTIAFALTLIRTRVYTEDLAGLDVDGSVGARGHHLDVGNLVTNRNRHARSPCALEPDRPSPWAPGLASSPA